MANRRPLGKMIDAALARVGTELYQNQMVNSERSFQAAMWEALRWQFSINGKKTYKIFIEPRLSIQGSNTKVPPSVRYPDLVICNSKSVVAVLELKFTPRGPASNVKDMGTFELLVENRKRLVVTCPRFFPQTDVKEYQMAESILFGWVAIAKRRPADFMRIKGVRSELLRSFVYETNRSIP